VSDPRRWIYAVLDATCALGYAAAIGIALPRGHADAEIHLWSLPIAAAVAAVGTVRGNAAGRRLALAAATVWLAAAALLILRVCVSAGFLAGVYGAFGKAAASGAIVIAALVVEVVALVPLFQVKFLMSRVGRRAYAA
jgi:hypothetical protein